MRWLNRRSTGSSARRARAGLFCSFLTGWAPHAWPTGSSFWSGAVCFRPVRTRNSSLQAGSTRNCMRNRRNGIVNRPLRTRRNPMATPDSRRKNAPPEETLWQRWRFAIRLLRLLWELAPGAMFVNAFVTLGLGLLPLLPLALLSRLVNVVLLVAQGKASYREALL